MHFWKNHVLILCVIAAMALTLCGAEPSSTPGSAAVADEMNLLDDKTKLGVGDRVSFRIKQDRDEPRQLTVLDSGEITVPWIGRVKATDKTCKQLAYEVRTVLESNFYNRATVLISVDTLVRSRGKIQIVGQVRAQGSIDIPTDEVFTVGKAILRAGGFAEFADKKRVKLIRRIGPGEKDLQTLLINVDEIWEKGRTDKDILLQPDDLIFVPQRLFNL